MKSLKENQKLSHHKNFFKKIKNLTLHHKKNCKEYATIIDKLDHDIRFLESINEIPFLPVELFKKYKLSSVPKSKVHKVLLSSGTSGSQRSNIILDKANSISQIKTLKILVEKILGKQRLPMLIADEDPRFNSRKKFSASIAAVYGFSIFGSNHTYIKKNKEIDYDAINSFLEKFHKDKFLLFGFTSNLFEIFFEQFKSNKIKKKLENAIIIHGGGWKKIENKKISKKKFNAYFKSKYNIDKIYNYYGLVEQTGSIFFECFECKRFVTTEFSDVIIRDKNLNICENNKLGMIQLISSLPTSYPGHSILTQDEGKILGENNCKCKKNGKYFEVKGRIKNSDIRGCSDVS